MAPLLSELRQVFRRLGRAPMFTAVTLVMLSAGVGANTAIFSVLEGVLLKPLPYPHSEELVGVWHTAPGIDIPELNMAPSNYFIYHEQSRTFQNIGIYDNNSCSVTGIGDPEQVRGVDVTAGVFLTLEVRPAIGRVFSPDDDSASAPKTIVLAYAYWQRRFGGSPSAIGRTMIVDGNPREIIGVLPQGFWFPNDNDPLLFLPLQLDRNKTFLGQFSYQGIARLRSGTTVAAANSDVARMLPIVLRSFPPPPGFSLDLFSHARVGPNVRPLKQDVVGNVGKLLWVLMASIGLVLLIACANVANLMLVRTEGRQQEFAIRTALGASRGRIAVELLLESLVIGVLGSVIGLGFAYVALRALVRFAPAGLPRLGEIGIDPPVLLFAVGIALITSLLFGLVPVFKYADVRASTGLHESHRTLSHSRERYRARNALVVVQVALAFVLLICSGLMIRTFLAITHVNPGFARAREIQTFGIFIPDSDVSDPTSVVHRQEEILERLAAIPGVISVGFATSIPMDGNTWWDPVFAEDRAYAPGELAPVRRFVFISPDYFQTIGTPLVAGRNLTWTDIYEKLPVALISENFAREYWHDPAKAVGKRIRVSTIDDWREIIGVVRDASYNGMDQAAPTIVYWPVLMPKFESEDISVRRAVTLVIRSPRAGSQTFINEIQHGLWSVDANLPLARVRTLESLSRESMARTSFTLVMLGIAGAMALLLGIVGLYGVLAYSVSQRTREIGIRIALGAQQKELIGMFVRQGMLLAGIGAACGIAAAFGATGIMESLLFRVSPADPTTYLIVTAGLVATAFVASYLPSRRAAAVNPVESLSAE